MRIDAGHKEAVAALEARGFTAGEATAALNAARSEGISQVLRAGGSAVTVTYVVHGQFYLYIDADAEAAS